MDIGTIYIKGAIVVVLLSMIFGAWRMRGEGWNEGILIGAIAGFMFSLSGVGLLTVIVFAITFLFS